MYRNPLPFAFVSAGDFGAASDVVVNVPAGIESVSDLFRLYNEQLRWPGYFGWNWNAFDECMRTLEWIDTQLVKSVCIYHSGVPFSNDDEALGTYIDILLGAVDASMALNGPRISVSFLDNDMQRILSATSVIYSKSIKSRSRPYDVDAFTFNSSDQLDEIVGLFVSVSKDKRGRDEVLQCFYDRIPVQMEYEKNWSGVMQWIVEVNYRVAECIYVVHDGLPNLDEVDMKYYIDMLLELIEGRAWSPIGINIVFPVECREAVNAIIWGIKQDLLRCV